MSRPTGRSGSTQHGDALTMGTALEEVARLAANWFRIHMLGERRARPRDAAESRRRT